jgi:hypothetical protein
MGTDVDGGSVAGVDGLEQPAHASFTWSPFPNPSIRQKGRKVTY